MPTIQWMQWCHQEKRKPANDEDTKYHTNWSWPRDFITKSLVAAMKAFYIPVYLSELLSSTSNHKYIKRGGDEQTCGTNRCVQCGETRVKHIHFTFIRIFPAMPTYNTTYYSAMPLSRSHFLKYSQRASYGVSFVDPASDWYSASVPVIINVTSYNIGPHYNGTRLILFISWYNSC